MNDGLEAVLGKGLDGGEICSAFCMNLKGRLGRYVGFCFECLSRVEDENWVPRGGWVFGIWSDGGVSS